MSRSPLDPRDGPLIEHPTRRGVATGYAITAAVILSFWISSRPLAGAAVVATAVGLAAGVRRGSRVVRCFFDCGGVAFDLGGRIRITIDRPTADDAS